MRINKIKIYNLLLVIGYYILFYLMLQKINSIRLLSTMLINALLIIPLIGMARRRSRLSLYKILDTIVVVIFLFAIFLFLELFINLTDFILINSRTLYCLIISLCILPIILIMKEKEKINKDIFTAFIYVFLSLFLILNFIYIYISYAFNILNDSLLTLFYLMQIISFLLSVLFICFLKKIKNLFYLNVNDLRKYKINFGNNDSNLYFYTLNIFNFYSSILLVYYILVNKFYYSFEQISNLYKECYINSLAIIILVSFFVYYIFIKNNNKSIERQILNLFKISLPISIFISILSKPLFLLIYNSGKYYFLMFMIWFILIISLYILLIKYATSKINIKLINIVVLLGVIFKIILIYPLIGAVYRMGYNLIYGDILANMISYMVVIILLVVLLKKKRAISLKKYFDLLLTILYNNIIYSLILILLTLFIDIDVKTRFNAVIVILIYLLVSIIFAFLKKIKWW